MKAKRKVKKKKCAKKKPEAPDNMRICKKKDRK